MSESAASKLLNEYISNGIVNSDDIKLEAKKELKKIELEINEYEEKLIKRSTLKALLKMLGDPQYDGSRDKIKINTDYESKEARGFQKSILKTISDRFDRGESSVTNKSIIKDLRAYKQEADIFANIKYLGSKSIIKNENGAIVAGSNWENRESFIGKK